MARPVMLGNGSLTVGLNQQGMVHDFYYPYVGLDNLATSRRLHHKIGIWVDDRFSWVDDGEWKIKVDFETEALISKVHFVNTKLNIRLELSDFVDYEHNVFFRKIKVYNKSDLAKEVRLFMHQVFQISRGGRADTALYVPDEKYILDYKGRCCLLIYGQDSHKNACDQFAIGNYGIEGKEGTFKDAEDGELSGSAVEHGGVDSVMRFSLQIKAQSSEQVDYWVIASDSQYSADKMHQQILKESPKSRLATTRQLWHEWLGIGANALHSIDKKYLDIAKKSMLITKAHIDRRGGIIASCDSSIYNYGRDYYSYVWPRDGAYAIWPLIRLGYKEEPKKFFEFCRDTINKDGYLMHKYQPDRAIGSTWHPLIHNNRKELAIQQDETSIVLYMLGEYLEYSQDLDFIDSMYETFVQPAANFFVEFIDEETGLPHASYDLWEEKFLTSTYTVATVYQSLLVAAEFAVKLGYPDDEDRWKNTAESIRENSEVFYNPQTKALRKGFLLQPDGSLKFDDTLDISSFYGSLVFGLHDNHVNYLTDTVRALEDTLLDHSPSGGLPRYENDIYCASDPPNKGNPWFVSTLWLSQYYVRVGRVDLARHYIEWSMSKALPSGVLPEQVNSTDSKPRSVTPLVWSHSELLNTILDIAAFDNANHA